MPPEAVLMQTMFSCFFTQATYIAAKLGVADLIKDDSKPVAELARATGTHERSLYRILRVLASAGIFTEKQTGVFANTPVSTLLRSDVKGSLRDGAVWMGEEPHWRVFGHLMHSVKTGEPAWKEVHGEEVFPYLFETNRPLGEIFNLAMTSVSSEVISDVVKIYDFSGVEILADIAGGYGHLLAGILRENPEMKGVLFDLPAVIDEGESIGFLEKADVAERVELVKGDFFKSVPVKADLYLLKFIIHDWDDEKDVLILKNIASEMADDAKILVIETVIPEGDEPHFGKIMDIEMLVSPGGIERTAREFETLFEKAGLRLNRIIPTNSPMCLIEAVKK